MKFGVPPQLEDYYTSQSWKITPNGRITYQGEGTIDADKKVNIPWSAIAALCAILGITLMAANAGYLSKITSMFGNQPWK